MLTKNERLCKCKCGQIIDIYQSSYLYKDGRRKSYYASKHHLPEMYKGLEDWAIEKGAIKEVINEA
jgi:hypothetical protein